MNVAIYHPWIYLKSGLERTIYELVQRSRHDFTIYTSHFDAAGTYPELSKMDVVELERVSVRRRYGDVIRAAARILRTRFPAERHDALIICCDGLGALASFRNAHLPSICLCFTPLRAVYDEEYRRRHLRRTGLARPAALVAEGVYRLVDRAAWSRFHRVVCISETVRDRVSSGRLYQSREVEVAYPGIEESRIHPSSTSERFFLLPGRIMWTKNIELAIEAFIRFSESNNSGFRLIIAGMVDRKSEAYFTGLKELAKRCPRIEFRTNLTDEQLQELYRCCHATLLSAFNEDLGLTPLEAACHGKPSIAVARGGPRELILDGETGLLVEPDVESFASAMHTLVKDDERTRAMGLAAAQRCSLYGWNRFVEQMDRGLDSLLLPRTVRA